MSADGWQPIETAPRLEPIYIDGWTEEAGFGLYAITTLGMIDSDGVCIDLLRPRCDECKKEAAVITRPTLWMPVPNPPQADKGEGR